jgi:dienelactone hydrolase
MFRNQRVVGLSWLAVWRIGPVPVSLATFPLGTLPARAEPAAPAAEKVQEAVRTFDSGGKPITVCHFEPAIAGRFPAVVLLHGADGPEANKALYHCAARRLAARGYRVLFVHYFGRTGGGGNGEEDLVGPLRRCLDGTATREEATAARARFDEWTAAVRDAVDYARALPGVDRERVGLVGFSLGAYLALSVAADEDLGIRAVVEFFGGLPRQARERLRSLPPVLGFHGDQDRTVPVKEAEDLRDLLARRGRAGQVRIYKGVGHVFRMEGRFRWEAALDAETRTAAFLEKHLRGGALPGSGKQKEAAGQAAGSLGAGMAPVDW